MAKFFIEKEVEYKSGKIDTWYYIKLEKEDGDISLIDGCKNDELKANELLELAVENWVPTSKTIIKEIIVDEQKKKGTA